MTSPASLSRVAARGAGITTASQIVRLLLQFGSLPVLARLLTPRDFGLVAMVTSITGVAELIRDMGLSSAAMQARELNDVQRSNLCWINTGLGVVGMAVGLACAPLIGLLYHTAAVVPIVYVLATPLVVSGFNTQFRADLSRNLRFTALAVTDLAAQTAAVGTSITMAALGFGYWSIVGQQVALVLVTCILNVAQARWWPGRPRRSGNVGHLLRFGWHVLATQMIGYVTNNVDNVSIGALWGSRAVGLYSRAYQLFMVPLQQVNDSLSRVVLPVLARVHDDREKFERYANAAQLIGCYFLATGFAVAAGLCKPLVLLLFGRQWTALAPIFAVLALGAIFRGVGLVSYWMYLAHGATAEQLRMYMIFRPLMIAMMLAGLPWGPLGVAIGHSASFFLFWIVSLRSACRTVGVRSSVMFAQAARAIALVAAPPGLLALLVSLLVTGTVPAVAAGVAASVAYLLVIFRLSPTERANLALLRDRVRGARRPPVVAAA